ncbi:MAG: ABC-2 family transporter protein [Patescibacteria group bacterium]|nr:ABC-2 family transporter protein [Patescibacteria group bacterium]
MPRFFRKFIAVYKAWWQEELEYRVASITWVVNGLVGTLFIMVLWLVTAKNSTGFPMSAPQIVTYFLLSVPVSRLTQVWSWDNMEEKVRGGEFTNFLLKPFAYLNFDLAENFARQSIRLLTLLPVMVVVFLFFRSEIRLTENPAVWFLFFLAVLLGLITRFWYENVLGVTTFWLLDVYGVSGLFGALSGIFSGSIIPFSVLPPQLLALARVLPFRFFVSFPLEIALGQVEGISLFYGFVAGFAWILFFAIVFKPFFRRGIKKYEAVGV